jgi:hypothetical protein
MNRRAFVFALLAAASIPAIGQAAPDLKVIYVGGQDCQPCVRWKNTHLDKWRSSSEYRRVAWFEIEPASLKEAYQARFWPDELKPVLDQLPRKSTTPRFLIVKDGKVVANLTGSSKWPEILADLNQLLRD